MAGKSKKVGMVTHYYTNIGVGIIKLSSALKVGDTLHFEGATTNFDQPIKEMQYAHKAIEAATSP